MNNMKAGKSTEPLDHRLDALAPGPAFDKAASWNKLQQRLEKKKKRAFIPWTWAAAAAVLIFIAYLIIPTAKKETGIAVKPGPADQSAVSSQQINPVPQEQPVVIPVVETPAGINSIQQAFVKKKGIVPDSLLSVNDKQNPEQAPSEIAVTVIPDPPLQPAPATVQKKKLRVVYNNDLVKTEPEETISAGSESGADNPVSLFKRIKYDNNTKADNTLTDEIIPRRKKGFLLFGPSIKPKD
jgi:hypothetical protein